MKKVFRIMPLVLGGAIFLYSCGKDDDAKVQPQPQVEFPTEFSEKTVAQNKEALEDNGVELMNNITDLKNTSSIKATISFGNFLNSAPLPSSNQRVLRTNKAVEFMNMLGSFGKGQTSTTKVLTNMRTTEDTTESIQKFYNENLGVYSYNSSTQEWSHSATGDKIIFKFPATSTGTSNNAIFTIHEYKGVQSSNVLMDDYYGDYPTSVKADLTVDGKVELSYNFSASYNSNGDPSSVNSVLTIGDFKLTATVANTISEAKADYSFTRGTKSLFAFGSNAKGNFDSKANQNTEDVSSVITSGSAYFQILNIKFSGECDVKALDAALKVATTLDQEVAAINANYKLIVFYADSKKKIADTEFYGTTATREHWSCGYDENGFYSCTEHKEQYEVAEIRLVFADKTKADLETYTDTGFEDIQKQYEDMIADLNNDIQ